MKRSIKYKGIKEIVYTLDEQDLNQAAMQFIKDVHCELFVSSQKPARYNYEWGDNDNGTVYLEIKQTMVESEDIDEPQGE